ncbi:hypothetical protein LPB260_24330 [Pseudomonas sp. LPB0260]|uniref:hypothetical protein n=1 Tax=Pseudomonas sp. LPB0260 TaxID=2614442 RepID=UPI0015C2ADD3|nr:hypothetical protein [Pseudomonas sp. LPB0260]QLC73838.1 hypothetical protein LPB260_09380 [Pseudomonas sp. LPB0260]QLC76612.1 hypothetical protein LPB260_24330 [Pseudomonas sp. LPB0260]
MKQALIALLILAAPAFADEEKPVATQAAEAVTPYAEAFSKSVSRTFTEIMAGGKGPMAEGARANLRMQDQREREANRGTRKSMKECIKPGNVIDDDVKECIEGLREKTW